MAEEQDKLIERPNDQKQEFSDLEDKNVKRIKIDSDSSFSGGMPSPRTHVRKSHLFENKLVLAPMVRASSLPFRLLCLRQGADLVYSEELIDYRVVTCKRVENNLLGTIDLVDKDGRVIFRTCEEERNKIVFQLGSNDPERALKAAKLIAQDVIAIDFNFGCPKNFSVAGGMGAALLEKPEKVKALLTACVKGLDIPVTCKMRLLPKLEDTLKLVKLIESCGVSAIAVHGRTKEQRPAHDNDNDTLKAIAETLSIPLIANGESNNIKTYEDLMEFREKTKASSVMIGRAAMKDPAIFKKPNSLDTDESTGLKDCDEIDEKSSTNSPGTAPRSVDETQTVVTSTNHIIPDDPHYAIVREYVELALRYDNHPSNVKYSLQSLLSGGDAKGISENLHRARNLEAICELFGVPHPSKTAGSKCDDTNQD